MQLFSKKYFQDRPVLFLNLIVVLGALINIITVALRIDTSKTVTITRYQAAFNSFDRGGVIEVYAFLFAAILIAATAIILSARLYWSQRSTSLVILMLAIIALLFNLIVSGAILNL
jgi:hypothetical protein